MPLTFRQRRHRLDNSFHIKILVPLEILREYQSIRSDTEVMNKHQQPKIKSSLQAKNELKMIILTGGSKMHTKIYNRAKKRNRELTPVKEMYNTCKWYVIYNVNYGRPWLICLLYMAQWCVKLGVGGGGVNFF